jgi:hypothetical protein
LNKQRVLKEQKIDVGVREIEEVMEGTLASRGENGEIES